jgi:peptide/nickel transport system ATP-binding protein
MGLLIFLLVIYLEKRHWLTVMHGKDKKPDSHLRQSDGSQAVIGINSLKKTYERAKCCSALPVRGEKKYQVEGVSFEVGENEILAIIGQSGAGKTTLFKLLAMQEQRTAGSIKMFG